MLGLKLTSVANEIYANSLLKMNEIGLPYTLQGVVMENVIAKFRENALSAASEMTVSFDEEIRKLTAKKETMRNEENAEKDAVEKEEYE